MPGGGEALCGTGTGCWLQGGTPKPTALLGDRAQGPDPVPAHHGVSRCRKHDGVLSLHMPPGSLCPDPVTRLGMGKVGGKAGSPPVSLLIWKGAGPFLSLQAELGCGAAWRARRGAGDGGTSGPSGRAAPAPRDPRGAAAEQVLRCRVGRGCGGARCTAAALGEKRCGERQSEPPA